MAQLDPDAIRCLDADIGAADREFRVAHTGATAEYLVSPARRMFDAVGVHLTDTEIEQYALSVADDEPFEFTLQ